MGDTEVSTVMTRSSWAISAAVSAKLSSSLAASMMWLRSSGSVARGRRAGIFLQADELGFDIEQRHHGMQAASNDYDRSDALDCRTRRCRCAAGASSPDMSPSSWRAGQPTDKARCDGMVGIVVSKASGRLISGDCRSRSGNASPLTTHLREAGHAGQQRLQRLLDFEDDLCAALGELRNVTAKLQRSRREP